MDFSASGYLHFYNNNNFIANNWAHLNCNYWPGVTPQASALCAPTWHIPQMDGPPDPGNPPAHLTPEHGEHGLPSAGGGGTACNAVAAAKAEGEAVPLTSVPQGFNGQLQDETHCLMRTRRGRGVAVQYTELPRPPAGPDGAPGNRLFEALAQQLTGCSPLRERLFPRVALLRRRVGEHLAARRAAYLEHLLDAVLTNQDHYPLLRFADASGVPNAEAMMLAYIADIDSLVEQRHFGAEVIRACADLEAVAVVVLTEGLWAHTVQPVGVPAQRTLCVYKGANGQYASVLQIARDDGDLPPPTPAPSAPLFSTAPPPLPRSPPPPTPSPPRCTPPSRSPPPAMPPSPKVAAAASGSPALPQDCLAAVASAAAVKTEPRDEEDVAVVLKKEPRDEEDDAVVLMKEPRDEEDGAPEMKSVKREPSETCDSSEADKSQVESEATPGIGEECLAPTESVESEDKTDSGAIAQCDDDTSNTSAVGAHEGPKSTSEGLYDPSRNVAVDRKSVSGEVDECAGGVSDRSETAVIEKCPSDAGLLAKCAEGSCSASSDSVGPDRTAPSGTDNRAGGLGYKCASIYRTDGRTLIELCGGKLGRRGVGEGGGQDGAARSQSANESGSIHESDSSGAAEETVSPAPDDGDPEDDEDDVNKKLELVLRGLMDFVESSDDDSATNVAALTDAEDSDERVKGGAEAAVKQVNADDLDKRQDAAKCARADRVVLPTSVPATASAASKKRPTPLPCSAPISPMKATRVVQTRYCLVNAPRVDVGDAGSSPSNGTLKKPVASKAPGSAKQRSTGTPTPSSAAPAPPDAAALSRLTGESTGAARPNTMPWLKLATWRVGPLPHHMHTFGGSILLKHMRQHHIDVVALYGVAAAGWAGAKSKNFDGYRVVWSGPPGQPSSGFAVHSSALDKDSVMSLGSVTRLLLRAKTLKVRDTCVVCANAPEPQAEGLGEGPAQTQFYEDLCRVLEAVAPDAMLIVVGDFGKLDGAQFAELAKRFDLEHRAIWAATTTLGTMESMQADAHSKVARIENLFIRRSRGQWVRYFSTAMSVKAAKKAVPRSVHCTAVVQVDVLDVRRSSAAISAAIAWPTTQTSGKRKMSESEPVECAKRRAGPVC